MSGMLNVNLSVFAVVVCSVLFCFRISFCIVTSQNSFTDF
jgi:hypothetical protein